MLRGLDDGIACLHPNRKRWHTVIFSREAAGDCQLDCVSDTLHDSTSQQGQATMASDIAW